LASQEELGLTILQTFTLFNQRIKEDDNDFLAFIEWKGMINLTCEFLEEIIRILNENKQIRKC